LAMVLSDVLRCVLNNIVCSSWFWPWYCLTFFDVFCQQGQTMLYKTHRRGSNNTMAKTNKEKQCYAKHIEECQTIDVFCITLFILVDFGHGIFSRYSMCFVKHCLSLLVLAMVLSDVHRCVSWPKHTRTNNVIQNRLKNV
jgi:hypothetical protein